MAGGQGRRSGRQSLEGLRARGALTAVPTPPATTAGPLGRHCWVTGPDGTVWPGLLVEWERTDTGWRGRVVTTETDDTGEAVIAVRWVPAERLTPA